MGDRDPGMERSEGEGGADGSADAEERAAPDGHPVPEEGVRPGNAELDIRSSLERGRAPLPGPEPPPFFWYDVVHEPLPPQSVRGEGEIVLYHGMEVDPEVRLVYTTRVVLYPMADEEEGGEEAAGSLPRDHGRRGDHRLVVDCRVNVQKRALLEMMDRARRRVDAFVQGRRRILTERGAARTERIEEYSSPRLRRLARGLLRTRVRVVRGALEAFRNAVHAAVVIPDRVAGAALRAQTMLHTRLGRRTFWDSVKNPRMLTLEERGVMVFLMGLLTALTVLGLNTLFALGLPEHAPLYRRVLADTGVMVLGVLFLPIPEEPLLVLSVLDIGPAAAFTGFMVGKMLGVWIIYLLGTTIHETLADRTEDHPRIARGVDWLRSHGDRHGAAILVVGNALPLVAGVIVYPLAVAGMRFRDWMGGIAAGTALRYAVIIAAVLVVGPAEVEAWFADPMGALGFG